jgi:hypothetical protein
MYFKNKCDLRGRFYIELAPTSGILIPKAPPQRIVTPHSIIQCLGGKRDLSNDDIIMITEEEEEKLKKKSNIKLDSRKCFIEPSLLTIFGASRRREGSVIKKFITKRNKKKGKIRWKSYLKAEGRNYYLSE